MPDKMILIRDEFIDAYIARCKAAGVNLTRTSKGYKIDDIEKVAIRCACGEDCCEGWAMVNNTPDDIADYVMIYGRRK